MTASIEFDGGLSRDDARHVVVGDGRGELLRGRVEVRDISVVVLRVVELHDRAADDGLERGVLITEGRQRGLGARMRLEEARGPVRFMRWRARFSLSPRRRARALLSVAATARSSAAARRRSIYDMRPRRRRGRLGDAYLTGGGLAW